MLLVGEVFGIYTCDCDCDCGCDCGNKSAGSGLVECPGQCIRDDAGESKDMRMSVRVLMTDDRGSCSSRDVVGSGGCACIHGRGLDCS